MNKNTRPFQIINRCQSFSAKVYQYTVKAEKEYRQTLCKEIQKYSLEMVHTTRLANSLLLGSVERKNAQKEAFEYIEKINDIIPILRRCKCITISQESELQKSFSSLRQSFQIWVESDNKRIHRDN